MWAIVYSLWLIVFVLASDSSSSMSAILTLFKYFVIVVIPVQYAVVLASLPAQCFGEESGTISYSYLRIIINQRLRRYPQRSNLHLQATH